MNDDKEFEKDFETALLEMGYKHSPGAPMHTVGILVERYGGKLQDARRTFYRLRALGYGVSINTPGVPKGRFESCEAAAFYGGMGRMTACVHADTISAALEALEQALSTFPDE